MPTLKWDDAEHDEHSLAAALLDLLDRDPQAVAGIVSPLPRLMTTPGTIVNEIAAMMAAGETPTRSCVYRRIRSIDDPLDVLHHELVDCLKDMVATGRRSADVARRAAGRITARYNEAALADALAWAADRPGDPERQAAVREALDRGTAGDGRLPTALDAIDRWAKNEKTPAVPTGFHWFDGAAGGGLPVGGLTALVAPPGVGKSALALQWAVGAMLDDAEVRAVWAAGEMTLAGIGRRLVTVGSGLVEGCSPITMAEAGRGTAVARAAGVQVAKAIGDRLTFVEPPIAVAAIEAAVVQTKARLVVVDYLQLLHVPDGGRDRTADLDRTVGALRDMAIRQEAAVVVVSSLAKATGAAAHAGQLGRGTAEIGFAAELVYAGERHESADGRPVVRPDGTVEVTWRCAKARNGEPRDLVLRFDGAAQTYADDGPGAVAEGILGAVPLDAWMPPEVAT
jgi:RecA/RadA recombinase